MLLKCHVLAFDETFSLGIAITMSKLQASLGDDLTGPSSKLDAATCPPDSGHWRTKEEVRP